MDANTDPELTFAAYLRTGDIELLRPLADSHLARLVTRLQDRFKIDLPAAVEVAATTCQIVEIMHRRLERIRRTLRRNLGLPVALQIDVTLYDLTKVDDDVKARAA